MSETQDENPPPPQETQQTPTQQTPHTVSTIKLPVLKKGEYDIWAIKIEHYLTHTDYPIWEVIQNGNGPVSVTTDTTGQIKIYWSNIGSKLDFVFQLNNQGGRIRSSVMSKKHRIPLQCFDPYLEFEDIGRRLRRVKSCTSLYNNGFAS
ncbi:hypothetical protein Tco_0863720 [Tanacetum coccineum]